MDVLDVMPVSDRTPAISSSSNPTAVDPSAAPAGSPFSRQLNAAVTATGETSTPVASSNRTGNTGDDVAVEEASSSAPVEWQATQQATALTVVDEIESANPTEQDSESAETDTASTPPWMVVLNPQPVAPQTPEPAATPEIAQTNAVPQADVSTPVATLPVSPAAAVSEAPQGLETGWSAALSAGLATTSPAGAVTPQPATTQSQPAPSPGIFAESWSIAAVPTTAPTVGDSVPAPAQGTEQKDKSDASGPVADTSFLGTFQSLPTTTALLATTSPMVASLSTKGPPVTSSTPSPDEATRALGQVPAPQDWDTTTESTSSVLPTTTSPSVTPEPQLASSSSSATATVPAQRGESFVRQLSQYVLRSQERGEQMSVQVTPPDLGTIVINVRQESTGLQVRFETSNVATQQLLVDQLPQLQDALSLIGRPVEHVDVVRTDGSGWSSGSQSSSQGQGSQDFTRERPVPPPAMLRSPEVAPVAEAAPTLVAGPNRLQELNIRI